ncbi:MAG: hypothetical protein ACJ8F7_13005 [Gemmataceae bacterium]
MGESFVPLAHCGMNGHNGYIVLTATGKELAVETHLEDAVKKGLAAWAGLPKEERKPRFPSNLPKIKGGSYPPPPPKNGLILRSQIRALQRDLKSGELLPVSRLAAAAGEYSFDNEPQLDHVWLTEAEGKALLPPEPKVGVSVEVPKAVVERIGKFHLLDKGLGSAFFWTKSTGEIKLTVEDMLPTTIRMRLSGLVWIGEKLDYPVRFQGCVGVDRAKSAISRFDVLAIGKDDGDFRPPDQRLQRFNFHYILRPNHAVVLAIAFEKLEGNKPTERVPPYAIMCETHRTSNNPYFANR